MSFVGITSLIKTLSELISANQSQVDDSRILVAGYLNNVTPSPYLVQAAATVTSSLARYFKQYDITTPSNIFVGPASDVLRSLNVISDQINQVRDENNKYFMNILTLAGNYPISGQSILTLISQGLASNDVSLQRVATSVRDFYNFAVKNGAISFESSEARLRESTARMYFRMSITKCIDLLLLISPNKPILPTTGLPYSWNTQEQLINADTYWDTEWFTVAGNNIFNSAMLLTNEAMPPGNENFPVSTFNFGNNIAVLAVPAAATLNFANALVEPIAIWTNLGVGTRAQLIYSFVALQLQADTVPLGLAADSIKLVVNDANGNTLATTVIDSEGNINDTSQTSVFVITTSTISVYVVGQSITTILAPAYRAWLINLTLSYTPAWPDTTLFTILNYYDINGVLQQIGVESTTWAQMFQVANPITTLEDNYTNADFLKVTAALFNNTTGRSWANVFDWLRHLNPQYSRKYVKLFLSGIVNSGNVDRFIATPISWFVNFSSSNTRNGYYQFWRELFSDLELFMALAEENANLVGTLQLNS